MAELSQTLDRGLLVLETVARADKGLTVAEIAAKLGLPRTVVHRLVATLETHGFVRRDETGRNRVGSGLLAVAGAVEPLMRDLAMPVLRRLAEDVGATSHLTIRDGGEAVAICVVEPSSTELHVAYRAGTRHPLGLGAAGKAMGASPGSWITSDGELQSGAHGLAAAVLGVPGLAASAGVVSLLALDAPTVGPRVVAAALELSRVLR